MIDLMLKSEYDGCGKCWVGVRRLSRVNDRTSSPEDQQDYILDAAVREGGHIIAWADDWEVSGAVDPLNRPQFGPWLRDEMGPYDGIVGAAVDRIGRNQIDVLLTGKLMHDTGRALITHTHTGPWNLDDDTDETRFSMEALGAQMELRAIQRRNRNSTVKMRSKGRPKNKNAYGYKYVRLVPMGEVDHVEIDDVAAEIIRNVAERILSDEDGLITYTTEAARLTREGIPSPADRRAQIYGRPIKGFRWSGITLRTILENESALGYLMHNERPVIGDDGHPVRLADPLWDQATRLALIKKMAPKRTGARAPKGSALLLKIAFCGKCGHRLYKTAPGPKTQGLPSYVCMARQNGFPDAQDCKPGPSITIKILDAMVETKFLAEVGHVPLYNRVYDPGTGHAARIAELEADRKRLQEDRDAGLYDEPDRAEWFRTRFRTMTAEIRQLKVLPERSPGMYWQLTGKTVADQWNEAPDDAARRELLAAYDFRVVLFPQTGNPRVHIHNLDPTNEDAARRASWEAHELAIETEKQYRAQAEAEQAKADQAEADAQASKGADKQDPPAPTEQAEAEQAGADAQASKGADKQDPPAPTEQAAGFWTGRPADEDEPDDAA